MQRAYCGVQCANRAELLATPRFLGTLIALPASPAFVAVTEKPPGPKFCKSDAGTLEKVFFFVENRRGHLN